MQHSISQNDTSSAAKLTRVLLICGVVAGPLFTVVGLIQAFTRQGFDLTRHAFSLLENGTLGWIQITSFVLTGSLFVACAIGMRRVLRGTRGGTWGPVLIGACGVGLIGAGCFTADPGLGFPPGTPTGANMVSWHGIVHLIVASLSFLAIISACFVFTRRFASQGLRGWVIYSLVTGVIAFISFAGEASGQLWINLAFVLTALGAYIWLSAVAAKLYIVSTRAMKNAQER